MYIFEGRGKGATWSLLLEALHNQGVYVTAQNSQAIQNVERLIQEMRDQEFISVDGQDYLKENIFTLEDWKISERRGRETKVYLDVAMIFLGDRLFNELGTAPEAIALGNDDLQIVHPKQFKEMKNTFVRDQREYFGRGD